MKKRISTLLVAALLIVLLGAVGVASADDCTGDFATFQVCFDAEAGYFNVIYLKSDLQGQMAGEFPMDVFPYAASFLEENTFMTTSVGDGLYSELYFTGKSQRPQGDWYTTWTAVIFDANGNPLVYGEFYRSGVVAEPDATLPFALGSAMPSAVAPAAAAGTGGTAVVTANVPTTPYTEGWEPTIVMPGTVQECLVRSTYTVRLRQAPTTAAPILDSVPFGTSMPADLRTADDEWVRAYYVGEGGLGQLGWVSADYVDQSDACGDIALAAPIGAGEVVTVTSAVPAADPAAEEEASEEQPAAMVEGLDLTVVVPGTVPECLVRSNYTVRLRLAPSSSAPIADNVPYRTSMPADLLTTDDQWIRANYLGLMGWVNTGYLTLSDACVDLNKIAPMP